jgi:hypothetical protein
MQTDPTQTTARSGSAVAAEYFAGDLDRAGLEELVAELHLAAGDLAAAPTFPDLTEQLGRVRDLTTRVGVERDRQLEATRERLQDAGRLAEADHLQGAARVPVTAHELLLSRDVAVPADRAHELADSAVGLFLEYRDQHGYGEQDARPAAVAEVLEGDQAREEIARAEAEYAAEHGWPTPEPTWTARLSATPTPTWSNYHNADQERGWER